ncbi:hypothetical protein CEXT_221271 [Caerostris extrusa]|uniref:Uncharacterized protein n=1 Tax=Caerostris extrusa TaxID=172846 RepID=A0AAV4VZG8_CAEEX|nr:hypothetical protein CEXT_221271 [Caerostris extrusa]
MRRISNLRLIQYETYVNLMYSQSDKMYSNPDEISDEMSPPNSSFDEVPSAHEMAFRARPAASNRLLHLPHLLPQLHRILPAEYSTHRIPTLSHSFPNKVAVYLPMLITSDRFSDNFVHLPDIRKSPDASSPIVTHAHRPLLMMELGLLHTFVLGDGGEDLLAQRNLACNDLTAGWIQSLHIHYGAF